MGKQVAARLYGGVAQLGEHLPCKQGVKSSKLSVSTATDLKIGSVVKSTCHEKFSLREKACTCCGQSSISCMGNASALLIYYSLYLENFIQNDDKIIEYLIRRNQSAGD